MAENHHPYCPTCCLGIIRTVVDGHWVDIPVRPWNQRDVFRLVGFVCRQYYTMGYVPIAGVELQNYCQACGRPADLHGAAERICGDVFATPAGYVRCRECRQIFTPDNTRIVARTIDTHICDGCLHGISTSRIRY